VPFPTFHVDFPSRKQYYIIFFFCFSVCK
jgi:hypothetical protein